MPIWLIRFFWGLPCRPQDYEELCNSIPEIFGNLKQEDHEPHQVLDGIYWSRILSANSLRAWVESSGFPDSIEGDRSKINSHQCPAVVCPLRDDHLADTLSSSEKPINESAPDELDTELFHYELMLVGGKNNSNSIMAFLELARKVKKQQGNVKVTSVYITDRYFLADIGETGENGAYNTLVEYLKALGLEKDFSFSLYLPSGPKKARYQKNRGDSLDGAREIVTRLIKNNFPNVEIKALSQSFHDRFYLMRDSKGKLSGIFGPSLNGLTSDAVALMGEIDDQRILKRLEDLL